MGTEKCIAFEIQLSYNSLWLMCTAQWGKSLKISHIIPYHNSTLLLLSTSSCRQCINDEHGYIPIKHFLWTLKFEFSKIFMSRNILIFVVGASQSPRDISLPSLSSPAFASLSCLKQQQPNILACKCFHKTPPRKQL